jgi:hypothetical protein
MPFWNAPEIKRLRKFIGRAFLLWLAALCVDCSPETQETTRDGIFRYSPENHVLPLRFWGSLKADTNKLWKYERFQATMTCKLQ